jgi:hypothetical protein
MNMLETYHYIPPEQSSAFFDLQVKNIGASGVYYRILTNKGISAYKLP